MASAIYPKAKESALQGALNMSTGTVKAALVDTGTYTYSAAHQFLTSLTGVVGTAQAVGTKTFTNGLFSGGNVTFTAVTGASAEAIVLYIDTGTAATSQLIAFIDTATGLPVTPNGGDITITWSGSGIFQL